MLLKKNGRITAAVNAVLDATKGWRLESVLSWEQIGHITGGFRRGVHPHWNGFRKRLGQAFRRQRGIPLFFFPGTAGLTLCSPRQTLTALAAHRMRKALRQAHFTRQAVASLDDAKLSVHERAHKARVLERTAHAARGMRAARKEFKAGGPDRTPLRPRLPV